MTDDDIEQNNAVNMSQVCKDKACSKFASVLYMHMHSIICNCQILSSIASMALSTFPSVYTYAKTTGVCACVSVCVISVGAEAE